MRALKSKKLWIGVVAGTIAGPWFFNKIGQVTGVNVSLPSVGGR